MIFYYQVEQDYGHTVQIGDFRKAVYVLGRDLFRGVTRQCCRYRWDCDCDYPDCDFSGSMPAAGDSSDKLEILWQRTTSEEIKLGNYNDSSHTAKLVNGGEDMIHKLEQPNPRWKATYNNISTFKCGKCSYGSDFLPVMAYNPFEPCTSDTADEAMDCNEMAAPAYMIPPSQCLVDRLNDDALLTLADHLLAESFTSFSIAYPRFHRLITDHHVVLQRELRCFFLRTTLKETIMGVGIALEPNSRTLSSEFDWISKEAFDDHKVRTSIQKTKFEFFLPLAFNRAHFNRAKREMWRRLYELDKAVQKADATMTRRPLTNGTASLPSRPHETVRVIYRMMNNIVVSLMKSCDDVLGHQTNGGSSRSQQTVLLHASERAVNSYCLLFHLLLCLCRSTPAILADANEKVRKFIQVPETRWKSHTPDLGELIVMVNLVLAFPPVSGTKLSWEILNGPFLEEAITRNVRWVLKDKPDLEVMEGGASDYRLSQTFAGSRTSLRLMMFQITFLDIFVRAYSNNISKLDDNYGFPLQEPGQQVALAERMVEEVKAIYQVSTWPGFFSRVQYKKGTGFGKNIFSDMLRDAVKVSGKRGYHQSKNPRQLHLLGRDRDHLERQWLRKQKISK